MSISSPSSTKLTFSGDANGARPPGYLYSTGIFCSRMWFPSLYLSVQRQVIPFTFKALSLTLRRCTWLSLVCHQQAICLPTYSCDQPRVVNALNYFTTAGFYPLPTDGRCLSGLRRIQFLTHSFTAFTILRTFALLKAHSWRFAVTGVLIALALTTTALATVRVRSSNIS